MWFEIVQDKDYIFFVHGKAYEIDGYPIETKTMLSLSAFFKLFGDDPKEFLPIDTTPIDRKTITPKVLLEDIQKYLRQYVGLYNMNMEKDAGMYDMLSHWILYTHIYDVWNTCSYLKLMGDYSSGKTIASKAIEYLSFCAASAQARITDSALYRSLHTVGGVKLLDELTLTRADMVSFRDILKSGIQKDAIQTVTNQIDYSKLDEYRTYCPKVVSGTDCENIDPVLSSRMIEVVMQKAPPKDPIARNDIYSDDAREEAGELRDRLYFFRLFHAHEFLKRKKRIDKTKFFKDSDLSNRFYDIYAPLFTISSYVCGKRITKTLERAANEQMEMRRVEIYNQLDVPILRILYQQLHIKKDSGYVWLTDKQISNEIIDIEIQSRKLYDRRTLTERYSPESIGTRIRGMGIAKEHKETEHGLQWKYIKSTVFKIIYQKGLDFSWVTMSYGEQQKLILEAMKELEKEHPKGVDVRTLTEFAGFDCQLLMKKLEENGKIKYDWGKWSLVNAEI